MRVWSPVLTWLFVAGWLVAIGVIWAGLAPDPRWLWIEMVLPLLAAAAALASLARRLPAQNLAALSAIILLFSGGVVWCGANSGIPFGAILFTDRAGPQLFDKLPVIMPCWWLAILVSSRETARLVLHPWHHSRQYGVWLIGLAALLAVVMDLSLEPFAVRLTHSWLWHTPERTLCWYSAPWANFLGWAATAVVTLGFCVPWFIRKRPGASVYGFTPALIWGLLSLHFLAGNLWRGLWLAAAVGGALAATVLFLAWHGLNHVPPILPFKRASANAR
ncbi:MAG: carotenoid biosynthesis protein [Verrucomicrobia bacterium]|nr:carotenoid biosynthesis protein [Verrucomicrobiota bacterium]